MNTSLASKLQERASMLQAVRSFFFDRGVLEVDCPALSATAPIDEHIDVMVVDTGDGVGYLHTSAEYGMKKLLSQGSGDIYQLSHVFRAKEQGPLHSPEFTMLEWYRIGFSFEEMIQETLACIALFLPDLSHRISSYRTLFQEHLNIDCTLATPDTLRHLAACHGIDLSCSSWDKDTLLQLLLTHLIEPKLGQDHLFVLTHFPCTQAALAQTIVLEQEEVALRFEVYYKGVELANGYYELTDPVEQRKRLEQANNRRVLAGKQSLPLDESFIEALCRGLPECTGVAVGFDRLLQLKNQDVYSTHFWTIG